MISFPEPVGPVMRVVLRARASVATRAIVDCITGDSAMNVVAIERALVYSRGNSITVFQTACAFSECAVLGPAQLYKRPAPLARMRPCRTIHHRWPIRHLREP